jgi:hypothetical protein
VELLLSDPEVKDDLQPYSVECRGEALFSKAVHGKEYNKKKYFYSSGRQRTGGLNAGCTTADGNSATRTPGGTSHGVNKGGGSSTGFLLKHRAVPLMASTVEEERRCLQ